ncbi:MAG: hypothetical protein AB7U79_04030 [Candidatus Izemoplasmatales bacterium]
MPQVYGLEHFLYLFTVFSIYAVGFYLIHKFIKTEKQVTWLIKGLGLVLFLAIMWNRISVSALRDGWDFFIPSTFCGFSSLALSLGAIFLKKDHPFFHSVAFVGLLGGLLTTFYPDFIGQSDSIFYPMTISGLVHHSVMVFLVIVMIQTKFLIPTKKKWFYLPLGLSLYMTFGLFQITVLGYNDAMYIYHPILEGTALNWFVLGMIFLPYHFIFVSVFDYFRGRQ